MAHDFLVEGDLVGLEVALVLGDDRPIHLVGSVAGTLFESDVGQYGCIHDLAGAFASWQL